MARAPSHMAESIPAQALVAYNEHCFFTGEFTTELYIFPQNLTKIV